MKTFHHYRLAMLNHRRQQLEQQLQRVETEIHCIQELGMPPIQRLINKALRWMSV